MNKWQAIDRFQVDLLPSTIDELLPQNHLARFVVDVVETLDLSPILKKYEARGRGSTPYHPSLMIALLFYGYSTGVMSSRRIERACKFDIAFRYIACGHAPDHDTIATFRRKNLAEIPDLFVQILLIAKQMKLLKVGTVAIDGTKIKANASKHKALSFKRAQELENQLQQEVKKLMALAEQADNTPVAEGIDIPEEITRRETRLMRIKEAQRAIVERHGERVLAETVDLLEDHLEKTKEALENGKKLPPEPELPSVVPPDGAQENLTDSDSRIMPDKGAFSQCYNAQASADCDSMLILGNHVSQSTNDKKEFLPALRRIDPRVGTPTNAVADNGFFSAANMEASPVPVFLAPGRTRHHVSLEERLAVPTRPEDENPLDTPVNRMRHRLKTPEGQSAYRKRKMTIEPIFGIIKQALGFRQFSLRGIEKIEGEWSLMCTAYNLKRMWSLMTAMKSA